MMVKSPVGPLHNHDGLRYVKKHRSQIAILIIFSIIATITSIVVPYLNGMFIDVLITTTSVDAIVDFALVIIAIGLFGAFDKSKEAEKRSFLTYFKSLISFSRLSYLFSSLDGLIAVLFQSSVLIIGGIQIINGDMTIGQFTIVSTYFLMLISAVKYYFNLGKSYQDYKSSNARMNELLLIEAERNGNRRLDDIYPCSLGGPSHDVI